MIRTLIIDHEQQAIDILQQQLESEFSDVEIVGSATAALEGIKLLYQQRPQLLLLDVNLNSHSGFDVLEAIQGMDLQVVIVTDLEEHAMKAIHYGALDYLLKPIRAVDLQRALSRCRERLGQSPEGVASKRSAPATQFADKLAVPVKNGHLYLDIEDIMYIKADGAYACVYRVGQKPLTVSRRLKDFERTLLDRAFVRAHNSHLVNLRHIVAFNRTDGHYLVMRDGTRLDVSRSHRDALAGAIRKSVRSL